jgi:hypothetical protein
MGLLFVFLLAVAVVAVIVYPLLPGRITTRQAQIITDGDVERAVRDLRRARTATGLHCPVCAKGYQAGDLFCVRCGGALPGVPSTQTGPSCPSCGAGTREGDQFCAKCGYTLTSREAA